MMRYFKSCLALTQPNAPTPQCKSGQLINATTKQTIIIYVRASPRPQTSLFSLLSLLVEGRQEERRLVVILCSALRDLSFVYSCDLNLYCVCIVLRSQSTQDRRLFRIRASKHIELWALLSKEVLCSLIHLMGDFFLDIFFSPNKVVHLASDTYWPKVCKRSGHELKKVCLVCGDVSP